ncbi:formylglycine-generating enzyme family protein [Roseiconus lacunae]|uniref:formylglycine-generating enzyme family protein n=1 Tax=Roseiconus lacunae TaxID=2605694 RepID=UPI0030894573|nr:formylglycine-generating enzyme family protein [Stieleria sp. HD01]
MTRQFFRVCHPLNPPTTINFAVIRSTLLIALGIVSPCLLCTTAVPAEAPAGASAGNVEPIDVPDAVATNEKEMKPYAEKIEHTEQTIQMVPIPGGEFLMGSPESEADRNEDEGPQRNVKVDPFWMGKCEITWEQYDIWNESVDQRMRRMFAKGKTPRDIAVDGVSKPTEPYTDMSFGMGREDYPAICMTQHAARMYCEWLSAKTGRYYRLPTEAEWEYACRAGTKTAYSFGDDADQLDDYGWYYDNSDDTYQRVGQKKPNPWGLHDMHGNVSEWVLDQYTPYDSIKETLNPLVVPKTLYPRIVRGGGWDDDPEVLRSAARKASEEDWKQQDPQDPKSIWYHTDALSVGFRVVRPLNVPSAEQREAKWDKTEPEQKDPEE